MAAPLSEADMRNVAAFYASKQPKPGFAKNKELVGVAEKLYRGGNADRSVPACAGCHGPSGAGIPSQYPRLSGSIPTTWPRSSRRFAAARATTIRRWWRSLPS